MLFDKTTQGLTAAVHYAGLRHKVIANNIANVDTPGYKALELSFKEQMEGLLRGRNSRAKAVLPRPGISSLPPPTVILAPDPNGRRPRIDRNTVSLDQELTKLSQNTIFHNTCLQLLNSKFRILKTAISGNV